MAKKSKSKKKVAPKKTKGSKKTKGTKKAKKKIVAKKKPAPKKTKGSTKTKAKKGIKKKIVAKKKIAKKVAKKKTAPKKVKKAAVKKPVAKVNKPVVVKKPIEVIDAKVSNHTSDNTTKQEAFKKHVTHLKAGDPAPFFEGVDQNGNRITSLDYPGKNIVLFFYPEDDTETCTIEACNLRDEFQYLNDNNYAVIGVSPDGVDSHERFASKYSLPYPIIADTDKSIIKAYDVWGSKQLFGRVYDGLLRTTFVIGFEGTIKNVITDVNAADHARQITSA